MRNPIGLSLLFVAVVIVIALAIFFRPDGALIWVGVGLIPLIGILVTIYSEKKKSVVDADIPVPSRNPR